MINVRYFILCSCLLALSISSAITFWSFENGTTITEEIIGNTTYYRTSEGVTFTKETLTQPDHSTYAALLDDSAPTLKKKITQHAYRFWTNARGETLEAKLMMKLGEEVLLELINAEQKKVAIASLSALDQTYVKENDLPKIKLDVGKLKSDGYATKSMQFKAKATYESLHTFPLPLDLHFFLFSKKNQVIGYEYEENIPFSKTNKRYELLTKNYTFADSSIVDDPSTEYGGYLVFITDTYHRIISFDHSNEEAYQQADALIERYIILKQAILQDKSGKSLSGYTASGTYLNHYVLCWESELFTSYAIQATSNLVDWYTLETKLEGTGYPMSWSHYLTNSPMLYRIVEETY